MLSLINPHLFHRILKIQYEVPDFCDYVHYASHTLKVVHNMPIVALLGNPSALLNASLTISPSPSPYSIPSTSIQYRESGNSSHYESSEIKRVDDYLYVLFDHSSVLGRLRTDLQYFREENVLIREHDPSLQSSDFYIPTLQGFKGFFYDREASLFYGIVQSGTKNLNDHNHEGFYRPVVQQIKVSGSFYSIMGECPTDIQFSKDNTGFEGAIRIRPPSTSKFVLNATEPSDFYILTLCDTNFCETGGRGRQSGNGRLLLLKKAVNINVNNIHYDCLWQTEQTIRLPSSVNFQDYSSVALRGNRIAIASQQQSKIWIGHLDLNTMEVAHEGKMYDFPRNEMCEIIYCNIEGIDWLTDDVLVAISDQMKSSDQSFRCAAKDQSVHVFAIP